MLQNKTKLYAFNSIISIISQAFVERKPHNNSFLIFLKYMEQTKENFSFENYIKIECKILVESGYRLVLDK